MATTGATLRDDPFRLPPGPAGLPLLGNVLPFRRNQLDFLSHVEQTYGRMATIYIGRTPVVVLFRPEHVRYILSENPTNFTDREVAGGLVFGTMLVFSLLARSLGKRAIKGLQDLVGDGLLTTDGDFHDRHRRLLQPAFTKRAVERHAGMIARYTREAMQAWETDQPVDLANHMQALILRVTAQLLLAYDVQGTAASRIMEGILAQPVGLWEVLVNLPLDLPFTPYRRRKVLLGEADAFLYAIIDGRRAAKRDVGDILSILLAADAGGESPLTRTEIRDEVATLLAAGYDTTSNTLVWTLYLLARFPGICGRVARELQAVEAFELDGYHFPAGTLVMFSKWVIHRLPVVSGDPETFRPERWDPADRQHGTRWTYIPFGVGPRSCLGMYLAQMETRLILATILQRFVPELVSQRPLTPLPLTTLRLKEGLQVRMKRTPGLGPGPGPHREIPAGHFRCGRYPARTRPEN